MPRNVTPSLPWAGVLIAALSIVASARGGENWPSFQNGGASRAELPSGLTQGVKVGEVAWSRDLPGSGQSSPVTWEGSVYVTSASGPKLETLHVSAFRLTDGDPLWQFDAPNPSPVEDSGYVSRAAPTPAADERGVVAFFEGGLVVALNHEGEVRWRKNLIEEFGAIESRHGLSASVEQSDDLAFIWVERGTDPYVLAIDKQSGETRWKQPGLGATSWASPRLVPCGDDQHLVLSGSGLLVGLDPQTGERLWTLEGLSGNTIPTPMPLGNGRMLVGATDGRGEGNSSKNAETNGVVAIQKDSQGQWTANYVWRSQKAMSSFGSPIAHCGCVYIVNRSGVLTCLDQNDGTEYYTERLAGSIWATPVGLGKSLFVCCKDGPSQVLAGGREFRTIAELESTTPAGDSSPVVNYGVALSGDRLLIRTGGGLICRQLAKTPD
ncbi:MAG: PQQ-binding-like beta-propeller repeat protein [Planctomycetaceae bacterium]